MRSSGTAYRARTVSADSSQLLEAMRQRQEGPPRPLCVSGFFLHRYCHSYPWHVRWRQKVAPGGPNWSV